MKQKKLLIFMPSIEGGGVEKNLFIISNYLSQNGIQVEVLTCNSDMKKMFNKNIKFIGTKNKLFIFFSCMLILYNEIFYSYNIIQIFFNSKRMSYESWYH